MLPTRDLADRFLAAKRAKGLSPTTLESYAYHLDHFCDWLPRLPSQPGPVEEFLASIPGARYRWNHFVTLRTFYRWLANRDGLANPIPRVERPKVCRPPPVYLDEGELATLLTWPGHSPRDRAALWLLSDTGMRIGEAHSITPDSVKGHLVLVTGKEGPRLVPIHPVVRPMLMEILGETEIPRHETIWRKRNGQPLTKNGLKRAVCNAFKRAGFLGPKMSAHRLRHTFATLWDGSDLEGRLIGGWKTAEMWERYHHVRMARRIQEHRRSSPVAQLCFPKRHT